MKKTACGFMALKIARKGAKTVRVVSVPGWMDLASLHDAVEVVLGEPGGQLWRFATEPNVDVAEVALVEAFPRIGSTLACEHVSGGGRCHEVTRLDDPQEQKLACLQGPDAAEKTKELRDRLVDVMVSLLNRRLHKMTGMSDKEKALRLGWKCSAVLPMKLWGVMLRALEQGGTCEVRDDDGSILEFMARTFKEATVVAGTGEGSARRCGRLTVPKQWVDWYAQNRESWLAMHEQIDILESYASAAVNLYGVSWLGELDWLMRSYQCGCRVKPDELRDYLSLRARWAGTSFRVLEDVIFVRSWLITAKEDLPSESPRAVKKWTKIFREQSQWPRWYPGDGDTMLAWAAPLQCKSTPEVQRVRMILGSMYQGDAEGLDRLMTDVLALLGWGLTPGEVLTRLVRVGCIGAQEGKPRQNLLVALKTWRDSVRRQDLNGNTRCEADQILKVREWERQKMERRKKRGQRP